MCALLLQQVAACAAPLARAVTAPWPDPRAHLAAVDLVAGDMEVQVGVGGQRQHAEHVLRPTVGAGAAGMSSSGA